MPKFFESLNNFNFAELNKKLFPILSEKSYQTDLTWSLMNLISITEHLAFTGAKTHKNAYYDLIGNVQIIIQKLFIQLNITAELEPISRNLLATSMRLMEVGTKQWSLHEEALAQDFFLRAYELQILFGTLNNKLITTSELQPFNDHAFQELHEYLTRFDLVIQPIQQDKTVAAKIKVTPFKNLNEFVEKVDSLKKQHRLDLSSDQDLVLGIMNLVNLEEEFFWLGAHFQNKDYYTWLFKMREMRKIFLQTIIRQYEGEVWCISKHLLAAAMRCMQAGFKVTPLRGDFSRWGFPKEENLDSPPLVVSEKERNANIEIPKDKLPQEQKTSAYELFQSAYDLYSLFWGLNLGVLSIDAEKPKGFLDKLGTLVKKAIDCCIE